MEWVITSFRLIEKLRKDWYEALKYEEMTSMW